MFRGWINEVCYSGNTIDVLRDLFFSRGLPDETATDNGSQFTAHDVKTCMDMNGI